jgi:hypothetical protein
MLELGLLLNPLLCCDPKQSFHNTCYKDNKHVLSAQLEHTVNLVMQKNA